MSHPIDSVRLHFLEALARRAQGHEGVVRRLLEEKLARARAAYQERLAYAPAVGTGNQPERSALAELTRTLTQHVPKHANASTQANGDEYVHGDNANEGSRPELKSMRYFRDTWSKLSVDKQIAQAIAQGPENAGPLNSHQLILRSLSLMRELSPAYLNRFMSYADTLLWLEQADSKPIVKGAVQAEAAKKRKGSRTGAR